MNEFRRCLYCGRIYKPKSKYQRFCSDCEGERMNEFKRSREFRECVNCGRVFLSVDGEQLCKFCKTLEARK